MKRIQYLMILVAAVLLAQTIAAQSAAQWSQMCQDLANGSNIPDVSRRQNQANPLAPNRPAVPGVYEFNVDIPNGFPVTSLVTITNPGGSLLIITLSEVSGGTTLNQTLVYAGDVSTLVTPNQSLVGGVSGWNFDFWIGTSGNDTWTSSGGDMIFAIGSFGDDTIAISGGPTPQEVIAFGNDGRDTVNPSAPFSTIYGGSGNDVLWGNDPSGPSPDTQWNVEYGDVVYAGADNDWVWTGGGEDDLFGQAGDDTLIGSNDGDFIDGGAGDDWIWGDEQGGVGTGGNDYIVDLNSTGVTRVLVYGGGGSDFIYVTSFNNIPDIWGDDPSVVLMPGNDLIVSNNVGIPDGQNVTGGQAGFDWFYCDTADTLTALGLAALYPNVLPSDVGAAPVFLGGGPNFWSLQADWPLDWWINFAR